MYPNLPMLIYAQIQLLSCSERTHWTASDSLSADWCQLGQDGRDRRPELGEGPGEPVLLLLCERWSLRTGSPSPVIISWCFKTQIPSFPFKIVRAGAQDSESKATPFMVTKPCDWKAGFPTTDLVLHIAPVGRRVSAGQARCLATCNLSFISRNFF